jgi:HK97 family phage prohead protease
MHDYGDKSLSRFATMASSSDVPSVREVPNSVDGTGLEIAGMFASFDEDSSGEQFLSWAFDDAIAGALKHGLPVLYAHKRNEVPVGYVKSLEVRPTGLFGSMILPAPLAGTKAAEIYAAVKSKVLDKFSIGGFWSRLNVGGKIYLLCDRLLECSLTSTPTAAGTRATSVSSVTGVKSVDGVWLPVRSRFDTAVYEHRLRDLGRAVALLELELDLAPLLA